MMHLQKLAVAGIAAIGAALIATPASATPSGFQTLEFTGATEGQPEVMLVDRNSGKYRYKRRYRDNDDFDFNVGLGVFPFVGYGGYGYGGYPYRSRYYNDDHYGDDYLHCHGKRYWRNGRVRCTGRWHRHYNY